MLACNPLVVPGQSFSGVLNVPTYRCFQARVENGLALIDLIDLRHYGRLMDQELRDELLSYYAAERPPRLLINFGNIEHCPTAMINALIVLERRVKAAGGSIALSDLSPRVRDVFKLLKLDGTVFNIYANEQSARSALQSKPDPESGCGES